jgi:pimeloyl-ACP methyl ester carboxylesterase
LFPVLTGLSTFVGAGLVYGRRMLKVRPLDRRLREERELILDPSALTELPIEPASLAERDADVVVPVRGGGRRAHLTAPLHYVHQASPREGAPLLLLLHGHSSSTHEFDDLWPHLAPHFETYSFDQPNCGGSGDVPIQAVIDAYRDTHPGFEVLHFLRGVIDAFVEQVVQPRAPRKVLVAGGSLGGNLGLFVAGSNPRPEWLDRVVVWSPASVWKRTWEKPLAMAWVKRRARRQWTREAFLKAVYLERLSPISPPQPAHWYSDHWGHRAFECKGACPECVARPVLDFPSHTYPLMGRRKVEAIERGYGAVKRQFTPNRASWHWEVAAEEIGYSHWAPSGRAPQQLGCDVDFVAGTEDRHTIADLFGFTREFFWASARALRDSGLNFRGRWLEQTGHSVHHERPTALTKILAGEL